MLGAKKRGFVQTPSNPPVYGSGDELKGCRCSAFVEICCMVCSFLVYIKFFVVILMEVSNSELNLGELCGTVVPYQ